MIGKTIFSIFVHREMVWETTKRDLKGIHQGAILGFLWIFINPLVQTTIYVMVVSFIFKGRFKENAGPFDYALYVLSGMIPWQVMMVSLQQAPGLIRDRVALIKQIVYPIETLPFTSIIVSCFGSFVSFALFIILTIATGYARLSFVLFPLPLVLLIILVLGLSWILSVVGVWIKDLREIIAVAISLLIYVSPVIASEEMVGARVWHYILLNPLSHVVICFRDIFQSTFHPASWVIFLSMSFSFFMAGALAISKTKLLVNEYI